MASFLNRLLRSVRPAAPAAADTAQQELLEYLRQASLQLQKEKAVLDRALDDISAVKLKEKVTALNEAKKFSRGVLDCLPGAVVAVDLEGRVSFFNAAAGALFGCRPDEAKGALLDDVVGAACGEVISRTLRSGRPLRPEPVVRKGFDGVRTALLAGAAVLRDEEGKSTGAVGLFLAPGRSAAAGDGGSVSAGELASGVARALKNRLGVISGYLQLLPLRHGDPEFRENFTAIVSAELAKLENMSARLLDFDETLGGPEDVPLGPSLERALLAFRESAARQGVETVFAFDPAAGAVRCPPSGLQRVAAHIAANALQAMPSGGTLTVTTRREGDRVTAVFEDTGCGIPQENIDKIFDPFFTTRDEAGGLGLTVVRKIVEGWGGTVGVESRVHSGTAVTVTFPVPA